MNELAKNFIVIGIIFLFLGLIMFALAKWPGIGKLPGDIYIKKENFSFYFPLTSCIIASLILSMVFYLISRR